MISRINEPLLTENEYQVTYEVGHNQSGIRLDTFLKEHYRKRSRNQLQTAIESGAITLVRNQGRHLQVGRIKPSSLLQAGDQVLVLSTRKPEPPVDFSYYPLFEDPYLMALHKPANLPVHPAGRYFFNSLLIHLKTHGHRNPLKKEYEYYLVHRIDKETSGVQLLAKDKGVASHITDQFVQRLTKKRYLAIVHGNPPMEFQCDLGMRRSTRSKISLKMMTAAVEEGGQEAFTQFRKLEVRGAFSLVECFPRTGRQHQIRVHLEAMGHPIVGDKLYGRPENESLRFYERENLSAEAENTLILPRHALHAADLWLEHPILGEQIHFSSPLPDDLANFFYAQPAFLVIR